MKFIKSFKKDLQSIEGIVCDSTPPTYWTGSRCYAFNKILSGSCRRAFAQGRIMGFVGPSGCLPAEQPLNIYRLRTVIGATPITKENDINIENCFRLTPTIMLNELFIYFSKQQLAEQLNISVNELININETFSEQIYEKMYTIFQQICLVNSQIVPIKHIQYMLERDNMLLISTPDGYQPIVQFFEKNPRQIMRLVVYSNDNNYELYCSIDHLVKTMNGWKYAGQLTTEDFVSTRVGFNRVDKVELLEIANVYDFQVGHDNQRYWVNGIESHNSGKSFLAVNAGVDAQQSVGAFVLAIDSENALDDDFVEKIGMDTSEDNYLYVSVITIEHFKKVVSKFVKAYVASGETRPVMIIADSLAMMLTDSEFDQLEKGVLKGDQGQRAKQMKSVLKGFVQLIKPHPIQMIVTDQVYAATQDNILNGTADGLWVVNPAIRFSLSNLVMITKAKLKNGTNGDTGDIIGVKMKCEAIKTRFTQPFQKVIIDVPYTTGINQLSGLKEVAMELGVIYAKGSYVVIKSTQDQFYWKDLNDERTQQILTDIDSITDAVIGKSADEYEEIVDQSTQDSITKKRLQQGKEFIQSNPTYLTDVAKLEE